MKRKLITLSIASLASSGLLAQSNVEIYGVVDMSVMSATGSYSGLIAGTVTPATPSGVYNGIAKSGHSANGIISGAPVTEYGSRAELVNGNRDTSRIGFRGTENLGGGLKASFLIESSIAGDGGTANGANAAPTASILGDREATLAIEGKYGQLKAGRQQLAFIDMIEELDPYAGSGPGNLENMLINPLSSTRANNSLRYDVTVMDGLKFNAQYSMSENSDRLNNTSGPGSITNFGLSYAKGPFSVMAAHLLARDFGNAISVAGTLPAAFANQYRARSLAINQIGGSYDFGVAKLAAQYLTTASTKNASDTANAANTAGITAAAVLAQPLVGWIGTEQPLINSSTYMLGLTVPLGNHKLLGSFVSTNDKRIYNQDGRSLAIGYEYALSKRTTFYARGVKVYNTNGSVYGVTGGGMAVALAQAGDANNRTNAYLAGISHSF